MQSHPTLCDPRGLWPSRLLCPWDYPWTRIQEWVAISFSWDLPDPGIKPTSLHLLNWRADSLPLQHLGSHRPPKFILDFLIQGTIEIILISSVQLLSHVRLFVTPWTAAHHPSLSITNSGSLLKLMSIKSVMPSNHLIVCHPLLLLPSIFPRIRVFSNESLLLIKWPKYWSFRFSVSPSHEYSGLISFRIDWLDLLAVQTTLKGLLQHHSSKASIL